MLGKLLLLLPRAVVVMGLVVGVLLAMEQLDVELLDRLNQTTAMLNERLLLRLVA